MSISVINNQHKNRLGKIIGIYLLLSAAAVAVDQIYGLFSHGVDSAAMTWMFLYPLLGGAFYYFIFGKLIPDLAQRPGFRLLLNLHSSGIGTLTAASFLQGVFEIAGTDSPHLTYYYGIGIVFIIAGFVILAGICQNRSFNSGKPGPKEEQP
mgnify:CR=1 FL=1